MNRKRPPSAPAAWLLALALGGPIPAGAAPLPLIDAHSQVDEGVNLNKVIPLMDKAGVARTLLSARGRVEPEALAALAGKHPGRIVPSVRTKGEAYASNRSGYYRLLERQLGMPQFGALAEVILWHAQKGDRAPQWIVPLDSPQAQAALRAALERGWPFIAHYEFAAMGGQKEALLRQFEGLAAKHPEHPFALIHMGQLPPADARRLIGAHKNIHFLTSHSNPVVIRLSKQPWVDLFEGDRIAPAWRELILQHPDRFVLAFDNVWPEHWGPYYLEQAALWRKALGALPPEAARALAHRNAERLWRLPPLN